MLYWELGGVMMLVFVVAFVGVGAVGVLNLMAARN